MALGLYNQKIDIELPHPSIGLPVLLVVEEAVRVAWNIIRQSARASFDLLNATEDVITHELYEALNDKVFNKGLVKGFNRELFTTITRESKVRNYNSTVLDKMPDLLIGLIDRTVYFPSQDWIFIECKPVNATHSAGKYYCDKGIIRFVGGDYAWTMTSALMIGYVSGGYTINPKLVDALQKRKQEITTLNNIEPCNKSIACPASETVHISQHTRTFTYVETGQKAPAITIRHLWLKRD
jgi:hypothetical protein